MAKGSACAMTGNYEEAVKCFTQALAEDPTMFDAWKRRGQTQAARGVEFLPAALADLDQVLFVIFNRLFISLFLPPHLLYSPLLHARVLLLIPPCFLKG
jgi:tetratricopeptide (TPR) repeat protein